MGVVTNSWQIKNSQPDKTRLLRKASTTFLITAMILMSLSAAALFFYTKALLRSEIDEELYSNKDRVERLLIQDQTIKGIPPIMEVELAPRAEPLTLNDTLIYDPLQDEVELFEQLSETKEINGQHYRITVRAMVIESEDILFAIVFTFIAIIFLAFVFLFYLNKSRNEKLWKPFFVNLERIKNFSIKSGDPITFVDSEILEFHELNREMESLTKKIQIDYRNLKQFTEDVSHEMQTPLAIMQAKIDTLINDEHLTEEQFTKFSSLQEDIQRLKQLNKKLILLAKIDNNQFTATSPIFFNQLIEESVVNFRDLTSVPIQIKQDKSLKVEMDRSLAFVLINNLISNAVKHSTEEYPIEIKILDDRLQVQNHGTFALAKPDQIFKRFYKESEHQDSTGLGLSIVKKICDYYGFIPSYRFRESEHIFTISFQNPTLDSL